MLQHLTQVKTVFVPRVHDIYTEEIVLRTSNAFTEHTISSCDVIHN